MTKEYAPADLILGVRSVLLPALALLGWGCLLPFLARADALVLSIGPLQLLGVYGTAFLLLTPVAGVLLLAQFGVIWVFRQIGRTTGNPAYCAMGRWLARLGFAAIFLSAAKPLITEWIGAYGSALSPTVWRIALVLGVGVLIIPGWPPSRRAMANLASMGKVIVGIGAFTVPFAFISSPPAGLPVVVPAIVRPNIVLISLDALSARQMSLYGAPVRTTPNIDDFARSALVFDRAYAAANFTTAGINTIMTGLYPSQHRGAQLFSRPLDHALKNSIPATLKAQGYRTGYVVSNPHAGPERNGYAEYFDSRTGDVYKGRQGMCEDRLVELLPFNCFVRNPFLENIALRLTRFGADNREYDPNPLLDRSRRFMAGTRRPFFIWTHFYQPHDPYAAPAPWIGRFDRSEGARSAANSVQLYGFNADQQPAAVTRLLEARYRESLAWADAAVGQLIAAINSDAGPNTVIIITSDHGESFRDGWGGHAGRLLNDDVIHIPLIVKLPGGAGAERLDTMVSQADIKPLIEAILAGAQASDLKTLIARRRGAQPVFSMSFIDNARLGRLTTGSIAVLGEQARYTRFLGGLETPHGRVFEQFEPVRPDRAQGDASALRKAVDDHLRQWGKPVARP